MVLDLFIIKELAITSTIFAPINLVENRMYKDGVSIVTSLDKLKIIPLSINLINTVAEGRVIPEKCLVVDSRHFEQLWGIAWNRLESLGIAWNRLESLGITWNHLESLGTGWISL